MGDYWVFWYLRYKGPHDARPHTGHHEWHWTVGAFHHQLCQPCRRKELLCEYHRPEGGAESQQSLQLVLFKSLCRAPQPLTTWPGNKNSLLCKMIWTEIRLRPRLLTTLQHISRLGIVDFTLMTAAVNNQGWLVGLVTGECGECLSCFRHLKSVCTDHACIRYDWFIWSSFKEGFSKLEHFLEFNKKNI